MGGFSKKYSNCSQGGACKENIIQEMNLRITVITSRLIRIESQADGIFCDEPTQTVLFRNLGETDFSFEKLSDRFVVKTSNCEFTVLFSGKLCSVKFANGAKVTDFQKSNLKGTRRTLDVTFGSVSLENGIISRNGVAVIDDSKSLVIDSDGTVCPRNGRNASDKYVFAYGHDYKSALIDFYHICGAVPMIPRYCLGNWWSRYWAYSQEEYLDLMKKFAEKDIPLTVACVDMDWHWTDVEKRFGERVRDYPKPKNPISGLTGSFFNPGWTGYSWNTELFPNYKLFLKNMHDMGLKVNLNVHPAQGVRFFEDSYANFAEFMDIDKSSEKTIEFDFTNKKFVEGYFKFINEPLEKDGVDFWWIDWQQGKSSKIEGLDPLWLLNHYYCLDRQSNGLRPLTLSRYAGLGSHRYPLGFSGDTAMQWSVLRFQPYFTATAANAGYTWWSHDIGGHNFGRRDDEMYLRWVQFGVFSPIMRFHSVNNPFMGKEPWKFSGDTERTVCRFLRLRHRMIPYTYSINRLTETQGQPLVMPVYHFYPESDEAYSVKNEYFFGTQLLVAPITERTDKKTNTASVEVWLPEGRYTDVFTGRIYNGDRKFHMCRDKTLIPVLAREGTILPLDSRQNGNDCGNPESFEIMIYRGDGCFSLYEDDGESLEYRTGHYAETKLTVSEKDSCIKFEIMPVVGDTSVIPEKRDYKLVFRDIIDTEEVKVICDGSEISFEIEKNNGFTVKINGISFNSMVTVFLSDVTVKKNPRKKELLIEALSKVQGDIFFKRKKYGKCLHSDFDGKIRAPSAVKYLIEEIYNME